ncbi:MAG: hypothetical protein IPK81_11570 [Rhodospirillales bacterium]|nr:MAG: hypothetical protein IPK81_11570 [Rhodospirillales bacterium]
MTAARAFAAVTLFFVAIFRPSQHTAPGVDPAASPPPSTFPILGSTSSIVYGRFPSGTNIPRRRSGYFSRPLH